MNVDNFWKSYFYILYGEEWDLCLTSDKIYVSWNFYCLFDGL